MEKKKTIQPNNKFLIQEYQNFSRNKRSFNSTKYLNENK